jgi:hypothetical protein
MVTAVDPDEAERVGSGWPWLMLATAHGCGLHKSEFEFKRLHEPNLNMQDANSKKFRKCDDFYSNPKANSI